jgi:phage terminase small subunit
MAKEGYKPTSGMQSAARRAIKLKEQGKAKGAGTAVGWTRAGQLARGETLSLSTVKRMYSYFSRHEVDKKGKDWDNAESPSNGKIMWLAWGGDAGFSWSRKIVEREKNMKKSLTTNELVEEIKDILDDVVNPVDTVIEIPDDADVTKALRPEITKEQLGMVIEHLMEAIEGMIEVPEEDSEEEDSEETSNTAEMETQDANSSNPAPVGDPMKNEINWPVSKSVDETEYESDNEDEDKWDNMAKACWSGYTQRGMKEKNGRMVPNCVPIEKAEDLSEAGQVTKSIWNGKFIK